MEVVMNIKVHQEQETVEANNKINEILEDGEVHSPFKPETKAVEANLKLNDRFNQNDDSQNLLDNPTSIVTPQ
jgi:hypothetical protein